MTMPGTKRVARAINTGYEVADVKVEVRLKGGGSYG